MLTHIFCCPPVVNWFYDIGFTFTFKLDAATSNLIVATMQILTTFNKRLSFEAFLPLHISKFKLKILEGTPRLLFGLKISQSISVTR